LTSTITFRKIYRDGPYQLRVNPSAGALYPTEIYLQIRGIQGMVEGIYHLEVATDSLTLIYELIDDGIEAYVLPDHRVKGIIFLVSCAYYRSSWKYKQRGLRYCLLDSGHHLGAIEASAYLHKQPVEAIFDFDKPALNQVLGFENKEWVTAAIIIGEIKQRAVRSLRSTLPFVSPTDYFEPDLWIERAYRETVLPASPVCALQHPEFNLQSERFLQAILNRRSARRFRQQPISLTDYLALLQITMQPIPTRSLEEMQIFWIINRVEGREPGLYEADQLLKSGDFSAKAGYLCVNQAIARDSAVTLFFTTPYHNYQTASQLAGWIGHRLYLISDYLGISCSGIGAYFDDETREFLETDKPVLYAVAIGI
jgi:SagB-type dehydrogenase family enzyme